MDKLKKILLAIKIIFHRPQVINLITNSEIYWKKYIAKNHSTTEQLPIVDIREFIPKENQLQLFAFLGGGSLPTDILLLKEVCKKFSNCSYFEIGTWRGESVINVSEVAEECYTLNLSKKDILQMNLSEKYAQLHGYFSEEKENITHLFGNSMYYDFTKLKRKFDVIFIDGNHDYDFVKNDTKKVFEHLVHEKSIVIWHDYALHPEKVRYSVLAGILDGVPPHCKDYLYHVSNTLCAIYYPHSIKSMKVDFPLEPDKIFQLGIKIK